MSTDLNRRQALAALGSLSLGAVLAACGRGDQPSPSPAASPASPALAPGGSDLASRFDAGTTCRATVELAEGPYYFDAAAVRSDIREDREGATLRLGVRIREAGSCEPIPDAVVDIWHCDASGAYSGFEGAEGERFLRGTQVTDGEGIVEFTTIYPGFYPGRAVHIHAKVHLDDASVLTSQLFFDETVSEEVFARAPYAARGAPDQANASDGIFDPSLVLSMSEERDGYLGLITFDVERA